MRPDIYLPTLPAVWTAEHQAVFDANRRLVFWALGRCIRVASRLAAYGYAREDLEQIALVALMRAVVSHDPTRAALSTWIVQNVRLALRTAEQRGGSNKHARVTADTDLVAVAIDTPEAPEWEDGGYPLTPVELAERIESLDPRSRDVVRWRYGLDGRGVRTLAEIGGLYGIGKERARQLLHLALARLRGAPGGSK